MALLTEPKRPRAWRHPLWSSEYLKADLRTQTRTLTEILKKWAEPTDNWRALYQDTQRWRIIDPELDELIRLNTKATDSKKRSEVKGGRPRNDVAPEDQDFRVRYCEELVKQRGSRKKACLVTPYSQDQIYKMLNERYSEYDKRFADLVHLAEQQLVAGAEELIWEALHEATVPKDKAWIAKEILKVRDRVRWGEKLDIQHSGSITHAHVVDKKALLLEASQDLQKLFGNKETLALPEKVEPIIEAEVVE